MNNYWLIAMDYTKYDFMKMEVEYLTHNKEIQWAAPGSPEFNSKDNTWKIPKSLKIANQIRLYDVIFFYVYNIESQSGKTKARILLRGVVTQEPCIMEYREIFNTGSDDHPNNSSPVIGFSIGHITTLTRAELENDFCYSLELLNRRYQQVLPQGPRWPNMHYGNLNSSLIEHLENSFKQSGVERDFLTLIEHFNRKCFFHDKLGRPSDHKTFKRRGRGTDYFEGHHFIPTHTKKLIPALQPIVDADDNYVWLCSNCHNRLHYGRIEDTNSMLDILWKDNVVHDLLTREHFMDVIGVDTEAEAINWLKTVYKSSDKNPQRF